MECTVTTETETIHINRSIRWVSRPPIVAIVLVFAVVAFGAIAVLYGFPRGVAAIDLGSALMVLALMVTASVVVSFRHDDPSLSDRLSFRGSFARLPPLDLAVNKKCVVLPRNSVV